MLLAVLVLALLGAGGYWGISEINARRAAEEKRRQEEAARKAAEEKRRQEEAARKAAEEKRRQEEAARKAEEEKRRQEEAARRAAEEKRRREESARKAAEEKRRQEEEAARKAEEAKKRQAERERFLLEFDAARQQKQQNKLFVLTSEHQGGHVLLFRYDTRLAASIGWLLYARNQLLQYNQQVSKAAKAVKNNDIATIMQFYRRGLRNLEINADRLMEQITVRSEQIAKLSSAQQLLVELFCVPADGRIRGEISKGKYIIVHLSPAENSYGYIFEKEAGLPLFLETGETGWKNLYDQPGIDASASDQAKSAASLERKIVTRARLTYKRTALETMQRLVPADSRSELEKLLPFAKKAQLHDDQEFQRQYQLLRRLHLLARKDAGEFAALVTNQWKLGEYDLRAPCRYCKSTGLEPCNYCHSTGVCRICKGTGHRTRYRSGAAAFENSGGFSDSTTEEVDCPKECTYCDGHKKKCVRCKGLTGFLNHKAVRAAIEKERAGFSAWIDARIAEVDRAYEQVKE